MTGICGHVPGITCPNCSPAPSSSWVTFPPSDLGRIADALEKLVVALTAANRYAANEAKQREEAEPEWPEGFDGFRENHGWGLLTRAEKQDAIERWLADQKLTDDEREAKAAEARAKFAAVVEQLKRTQQVLTPEPDPLDEDDHRDRLDADGDIWMRNPGGCWHVNFRDCRALSCGSTLAYLNQHYGPLVPTYEAKQQEVEADPLDEDDHRDRLDGAGTRWTNASDGCWASGTHHVLELASLVGPLTFAPDAEPDPLDESDPRDRLDSDGDLWVRNPGGCWHRRIRDCRALDCGWTLAYLDDHIGPLTFATDAKPDPLDENDHRDRLAGDRRRIVRHGQGHWHTPATSGTWCDADCTEMSLWHWARVYGPLAFAPEPPPEDSSTHYYPTNIDRAPDGTAWSWGVAECHCNRPWRHE